MNSFGKYLVSVCIFALCALACGKDDDPVLPPPAPPTSTPVTVHTDVTSFAPKTATAGDLIRITGIKFSGATAVAIGNTAAQSFQVISDTVILAYVSNAGASSGKVSVTAPAGNADASGFIYYTPLQSTLTGSMSYATLFNNSTVQPPDSSKFKTFTVQETISFFIRNINPNDDLRNLTAFPASVKPDIRSRFVDSANFVILTGVIAQDPTPITGFVGVLYNFSSAATARSSVFAKVVGETITIPSQAPLNGYVYINGSGVIKNGVVVSLNYVIDDSHGNSKRGSLVKP